jgi:hypothetical protein
MLEPPGQSSAGSAADGGAETGSAADGGAETGSAADGGAETGSGTPRPEPDAPGPGRPPRKRPGWGRLPARGGLLIMLAAATLGAAFTVASERDPGQVLGAFVLAGTLAAATSVRARSAYAIIPAPALAYAAAAVITGFIHDRAADTTRAALAVSAVQWIADGFVAMTAATALAVLITLARWLISRRTAR